MAHDNLIFWPEKKTPSIVEYYNFNIPQIKQYSNKILHKEKFNKKLFYVVNKLQYFLDVLLWSWIMGGYCTMHFGANNGLWSSQGLPFLPCEADVGFPVLGDHYSRTLPAFWARGGSRFTRLVDRTAHGKKTPVPPHRTFSGVGVATCTGAVSIATGAWRTPHLGTASTAS